MPLAHASCFCTSTPSYKRIYATVTPPPLLRNPSKCYALTPHVQDVPGHVAANPPFVQDTVLPCQRCPAFVAQTPARAAAMLSVTRTATFMLSVANSRHVEVAYYIVLRRGNAAAVHQITRRYNKRREKVWRTSPPARAAYAAASRT